MQSAIQRYNADYVERYRVSTIKYIIEAAVEKMDEDRFPDDDDLEVFFAADDANKEMKEQRNNVDSIQKEQKDSIENVEEIGLVKPVKSAPIIVSETL